MLSFDYYLSLHVGLQLKLLLKNKILIVVRTNFTPKKAIKVL
jgi:hypothetical protein